MESANIFYPITYPKTVRELSAQAGTAKPMQLAYLEQAYEFGQCPIATFAERHPPSIMKHAEHPTPRTQARLPLPPSPLQPAPPPPAAEPELEPVSPPPNPAAHDQLVRTVEQIKEATRDAAAEEGRQQSVGSKN